MLIASPWIEESFTNSPNKWWVRNIIGSDHKDIRIQNGRLCWIFSNRANVYTYYANTCFYDPFLEGLFKTNSLEEAKNHCEKILIKLNFKLLNDNKFVNLI